MENLVLLAACFLAGMLLHHSRGMPQHTPAVLNAFIINVSFPALTLLSVRNLPYVPEALFFALMPWLHFFLAMAILLPLSRRLGLSRSSQGALLLTGGLGNTSFLGFPMIEAWFGREGLVHGILVDQLGSFMVLSTAGIAVAAYWSGKEMSWRSLFGRIATFPPFIALLLAFSLQPFDYPDWVLGVLSRLGGTLAPLALFSVGFQFRLSSLAGKGKALASGLGFKLVLAPALLFALFLLVPSFRGLPLQVTVFEAAMPPMITAGIIATEYGLDAELGALMVALGTILSFLTLAVWYFVLAGY